MSNDYFRDQQLDFLQAAYARASRIVGAIEGWSRYESAGAPPAALAFTRLARAMANGVMVRAANEFSIVKDGRPSEADPELVSSLSDQLQTVNRIRTYVEQSTHRSLHPVLSPTVRSVLDELGIPGQVLVVGARSMSYELEFYDREYFAPEVGDDELRAITWPLLIFLVPRPPLDWGLHHVMIFHEVGHAAFRMLGGNRAIQAQAPPDIANAASEDLADKWLAAHRERTFVGIANRWLEELYSDVFGLLAVGPAFLYAFCRVLGALGELNVASNSHPPTAVRIDLMRSIAERRGYLENLPAGANAPIRGWLNASEHVVKKGDFINLDTEDSDLENFRPYLLDVIAKHYDSLEKEAAKVLGSRTCDRATLAEDLDRADWLARLDIPPVEGEAIPSLDGQGTPLPAARIFARTWGAFHGHQSRTLEKIEHSALMEQYADGLIGALDGAEALRAWIKPSR